MEGIIKNKETNKWVKTWQRAGSALDEIKQRELCAYDYHKNRKIIDKCCNGRMTIAISG